MIGNAAQDLLLPEAVNSEDRGNAKPMRTKRNVDLRSIPAASLAGPQDERFGFILTVASVNAGRFVDKIDNSSVEVGLVLLNALMSGERSRLSGWSETGFGEVSRVGTDRSDLWDVIPDCSWRANPEVD